MLQNFQFYTALSKTTKMKGNPFLGEFTKPRNSHGFTVFYTDALFFSWSRERLFTLHGFMNLCGFFQNSHSFLRKENFQGNLRYIRTKFNFFSLKFHISKKIELPGKLKVYIRTKFNFFH